MKTLEQNKLHDRSHITFTERPGEIVQRPLRVQEHSHGARDDNRGYEIPNHDQYTDQYSKSAATSVVMPGSIVPFLICENSRK